MNHIYNNVLQARINFLDTWNYSSLLDLARAHGLLTNLSYSAFLHYLAEELPPSFWKQYKLR